jgi:hypothetical protein
MSKVYLLLKVAAAVLAFYPVNLGMKQYRSVTDRNGLEITPYMAVADNMLAPAQRTAHFITSLLNVQNYFAIFVAVRVALETFNAKRKV